MSSGVLRGSTVSIGIAVIAMWAVTNAAQEKPAQDPAAAATPRLAGQWHFNKELSSPLQDPSDQGGQGGQSGRRPGGGGGGGGRGGPGGGFGGRGGGGYGGGGGGNAGGGRGDGGGMNSADMLKMRELMRQLREAPTVLNIVVTPTDVTMTDDQGIVHKFKTDGKKQEVDFGTAKIDTTTKWDADTLTQEFAVGRLKMTQTYLVTTEGHMLVVTVKPSANGSGPGNGGGGQAAPLKFIYDRAGQ